MTSIDQAEIRRVLFACETLKPHVDVIAGRVSDLEAVRAFLNAAPVLLQLRQAKLAAMQRRSPLGIPRDVSKAAIPGQAPEREDATRRQGSDRPLEVVPIRLHRATDSQTLDASPLPTPGAA